MIFPVIPFFLLANMTIDTSEWKFGPKYLYDLNMEYTTSSLPDMHNETALYDSTIQLFSKVECRPKGNSLDSLFCHLENIVISIFINDHNVTEKLETTQMFEIKFNETGVTDLLIEPPSRMGIKLGILKKIIVRKIADQLNLGIQLEDLKKRFKENPTFYEKEEKNTTLGTCRSKYVIFSNPNVNVVGKDTDFRLMLPINMEPDTFEIQKHKLWCTYPGQPRINLAIGNLSKSKSYFTIRASNKFETLTVTRGKIKFPFFDTSNDILPPKWISFEERINLKLNSIESAQEELPSTFDGELIDLKIHSEPFISYE